MDIKVTKVDPLFVKEIDRKCKEISERIGRNFSRNEYIKMLIQHDAQFRLMELQEDAFHAALDNVNTTLNRQDAKLQEFIDVTKNLMLLITSGENSFNDIK